MFHPSQIFNEKLRDGEEEKKAVCDSLLSQNLSSQKTKRSVSSLHFLEGKNYILIRQRCIGRQLICKICCTNPCAEHCTRASGIRLLRDEHLVLQDQSKVGDCYSLTRSYNPYGNHGLHQRQTTQDLPCADGCLHSAYAIAIGCKGSCLEVLKICVRNRCRTPLSSVESRSTRRLFVFALAQCAVSIHIGQVKDQVIALSTPRQAWEWHHAPSGKSVPARYKDDLTSAGYASNLERLMGKAGLWIHGHIHTSNDYEVQWDEGSTRIISNPRGNMKRNGSFENILFNPSFVVEV